MIKFDLLGVMSLVLFNLKPQILKLSFSCSAVELWVFSIIMADFAN